MKTECYHVANGVLPERSLKSEREVPALQSYDANLTLAWMLLCLINSQNWTYSIIRISCIQQIHTRFFTWNRDWVVGWADLNGMVIVFRHVTLLIILNCKVNCETATRRTWYSCQPKTCIGGHITLGGGTESSIGFRLSLKAHCQLLGHTPHRLGNKCTVAWRSNRYLSIVLEMQTLMPTTSARRSPRLGWEILREWQ